MLNQIHQLLTRRLVQKKEQPKANKFQFSTGFPVAAPGPLLVLGVCSFWRRMLVVHKETKRKPVVAVLVIPLLRVTNKYADYFLMALCAGFLARRSAIRHLGDDFL